MINQIRVAMLDPSSFTPPYDDHLCRALGQAGGQVDLFVRPPRHHEYFSAAGYHVHQMFYRWSERLYGIWLFRPFYRLLKVMEHFFNMTRLVATLKESRPDVIHFQWCPLPVLDVLFLGRLRRVAPLVLTVHNTKPFHGDPSSHIQGLGWVKILRYFERLVVHTNQSRDQLVGAGFDASKIVVIPHGTLQIPPGAHDSAASDRLVGRRPGQRIILFFGNIKPYKGVDVLLRAFAGLPEVVKERAKLVIAGRSSIAREEMEALVRALGIEDRVELILRFLSDDELTGLLRTADLFVFPYRDIDASGALMLALPYGKPVVASRLGIFSELLRDGDSGLLVGVDDVTGFTNAMEQVLVNGPLANRLGNGARELVAKQLSWEEIARTTLTVYRQVAREDVSGA